MLKDKLVEFLDNKHILHKNTIRITRHEAEEIIKLYEETDRQFAVNIAQGNVISKLSNTLNSLMARYRDCDR